MFHYRFECRLNIAKHGNPKFVIEGDEARRETCVAIHNALIESPQIVITGASIIPDNDLFSQLEENIWIARSSTLQEFVAGPYVGAVEVYGKDGAGNILVEATAYAKDGRKLKIQPGEYDLPYISIVAAKRAVIQAIKRDILGENV
jgi:hypothetical protein